MIVCRKDGRIKKIKCFGVGTCFVRPYVTSENDVYMIIEFCKGYCKAVKLCNGSVATFEEDVEVIAVEGHFSWSIKNDTIWG